MRNVFLLYMPPGNSEAMVHYQDTIKNRVALGRIAPLREQRRCFDLTGRR